MGKLGGREMTAASDLDLILLYDHDEKAAASDGERPLAPAQYFRAPDAAPDRGAVGADRGGHALRGRPRLRPSGNKGRSPTHVDAFAPTRRRGLDLGAHGADPRARRSPATSWPLRASRPRWRKSWRCRAIAKKMRATCSRCAP
jgi:[glutamine synthetase] adenylyltransferase / [glutamine synthetase]-adenylyl-L-tyrosine phosphorylase